MFLKNKKLYKIIDLKILNSLSVYQNYQKVFEFRFLLFRLTVKLLKLFDWHFPHPLKCFQLNV